MATTEPLTLLETVDLLGRYRYVELAAFSALGRRAPRSSAPAVAVYLAGASLAHGWRARLVEERLPVAFGLPGVADCTRRPSSELDAALAVLAAADDADALDALLGSLYPAMASSWAEHVVAASPAADPPVVRMLGRLLGDLEAVRRDGTAVAARLPVPRGDSRGAVEELLGLCSGPFGPMRSARPGRKPAEADLAR
jgi:hypothetical protein